jgi:hypothetical protein
MSIYNEALATDHSQSTDLPKRYSSTVYKSQVNPHPICMLPKGSIKT